MRLRYKSPVAWRRRRQKKERKRQPRVRAAIARKLLKVPFLRRFYLKRLLKHLDGTPRGELEPELRELQTALARVPRPRRLAMLESLLEQGPEVVQQSRSLRRMAERQSKKARRR